MKDTGRIKTGSLLKNKYFIKDFLEEGKLSHKYLVLLKEENDKPALIKQTRYQKEGTADLPDNRHRMIREYRLLSVLDYPAIPRAYDIFEIRGSLFSIREYRGGRTLEDVIREGIQRDSVVDIANQLLDFLEYLHQKGIIYQQLTPSKIIIDENNRIFVHDFEGCRSIREINQEDTAGLGAPGFGAPEQSAVFQVDERSDIYSFGSILFYMLTGSKPIAHSKKLGQIEVIKKFKLGNEISRVLARCLATDPMTRYGNVSSLRKDLFTPGVFGKIEDKQGKKKKCFEKVGPVFKTFSGEKTVFKLGLLILYPLILWTSQPVAVMVADWHVWISDNGWLKTIIWIVFYFVLIYLAVSTLRQAYFTQYFIGSKGFGMQVFSNIEEYSWEEIQRVTYRENSDKIVLWLVNGKKIAASPGEKDEFLETLAEESGITGELLDK